MNRTGYYYYLTLITGGNELNVNLKGNYFEDKVCLINKHLFLIYNYTIQSKNRSLLQKLFKRKWVRELNFDFIIYLDAIKNVNS